MKWLKKLIYFLSSFALVFSVSILVFYFHASRIVGHLPTYGNPDPKQLEIYQNYSPTLNLTLSIWFYSFLVWLILLIIYIVKNRKELNYKPIIITLVVQIIPFIIFFSTIFEWYVD